MFNIVVIYVECDSAEKHNNNRPYTAQTPQSFEQDLKQQPNRDRFIKSGKTSPVMRAR